jgi:hypothetical protein
MEETRNVYNILFEKHERKIPHRKPMHRWKDNIKMDLK